MAAAKKDKDTGVIDANKTNKEFDFSAFMPAGFEAADLRAIGGFTPIYAPEAVAEGEWPPCVGFMDRFEVLPPVQQGKDRIYNPLMIRVVCTHPTKGVLGKGDAIEEVDVAAGEDILVPVTGNLKNNKVLLGAIPGARGQFKDFPIPALFDSTKVFLGAFRLKGSKDTGQPSEMWDWDIRLHPKSILRAGRYALPEGPLEKQPAIAETATGAQYDASTGEVKDKAPVAASAVS